MTEEILKAVIDLVAQGGTVALWIIGIITVKGLIADILVFTGVMLGIKMIVNGITKWVEIDRAN